MKQPSPDGDKESAIHAYQAILEELINGVPHILFAILHGSALESGPYNDLDVALWVDRQHISADEDLFLSIRLSRDWSQALHFPVDVHVINDAKLAFQYHVTKGIPLMIHDFEAFATFRERTWDMYLDFQPVAMKYLREIL